MILSGALKISRILIFELLAKLEGNDDGEKIQKKTELLFFISAKAFKFGTKSRGCKLELYLVCISW